MKITVHNLGAITEAEINIKPLTVFVGPNNTGKTWLAYAIAGLFSPDRFTEYAISLDERLKIYPPLDQALQDLENNGSAVLDIVQFAEKYGQVYINEIGHTAPYWMPGLMNTRLASFTNLDISVDLEDTKAAYLKRILNENIQLEIPVGQKTRVGIRKKRGDSQLYFYTLQQTSSEELPSPEQTSELPIFVIKDLFSTLVVQLLHTAFYSQIRILPAERTTAFTFPFVGTSTQVEGLATNKEVSQGWNQKNVIGPINTYLTMFSKTYSIGVRTQKERSSRNQEYAQLARVLEARVLSGKVEFSPIEASVAEGGNQLELGLSAGLMFKTDMGVELEISIASSMVQELAPLVLYLRDIATFGDLLIIDEPEKSLHPEAQVKMIEFLGMLVNAGLNVIVATHSPYVVDHLANLMKANEVEDKRRISNEFYLKDATAFISKDNVSVYIFDQGKTTKAIDEDGIILWNTFSEVSDRLSEIYFKL
jgi:hypothetical protein